MMELRSRRVVEVESEGEEVVISSTLSLSTFEEEGLWSGAGDLRRFSLANTFLMRKI